MNMIVLHRALDDAESDQLEEKLNDLVLAFKTESHASQNEDLPYIEEDGKEYRTEKEIEKWLSELSSELNWQRSLSGDGCYINPKDGTMC